MEKRSPDAIDSFAALMFHSSTQYKTTENKMNLPRPRLEEIEVCRMWVRELDVDGLLKQVSKERMRMNQASMQAQVGDVKLYRQQLEQSWISSYVEHAQWILPVCKKCQKAVEKWEAGLLKCTKCSAQLYPFEHNQVSPLIMCVVPCQGYQIELGLHRIVSGNSAAKEDVLMLMNPHLYTFWYVQCRKVTVCKFTC
jgi:hypothetical protein